MENTSVTEPSTPQRGSSHVRFTPDEHRRIREEAELRQTTIPKLLKRYYFKGVPPAPLVPQAQAHTILNELRRIGTNINQIARQLNTGTTPLAIHRALLDVIEYLGMLRTYLGGFDGTR